MLSKKEKTQQSVLSCPKEKDCTPQSQARRLYLRNEAKRSESKTSKQALHDYANETRIHVRRKKRLFSLRDGMHSTGASTLLVVGEGIHCLAALAHSYLSRSSWLVGTGDCTGFILQKHGFFFKDISDGRIQSILLGSCMWVVNEMFFFPIHVHPFGLLDHVT